MASKSGKGSRGRRKEKRKLAKRMARQSRQEAWAKLAGTGRNRRRKLANANRRRVRLVKNVSHPNGLCGNIGCARCSGMVSVLNRREGLLRKLADK